MSKQVTRQPAKSVKQTRQDKRREEQRRREEERLRQARKKRTFIISAIVVVALVVVAAGVFALMNIGKSQSQQPAAFDPAYPSIDGVPCDQLEQTAVHYHVHLSIYIDGKPVQMPANVGIASDCLYWLHIHDTSGVLHIESPARDTFTFGNFLHIWERQFPDLGSGFPGQLDLKAGWTVYVNGKLYTGDFHNLTLASHMLITMGYNSPNMKPDTTYNWNGL